MYMLRSIAGHLQRRSSADIVGNTSRLVYAIRRCKWPAIERSMYIAQLLDELEKEYL